MIPSQTLPQLFLQKCAEHGATRIAMREKDRGIWKSYTWRDYEEKVRNLSLFLVSLGMKPGDKVALLGENKPEIYWAELAAQVVRGAAVGIFSDCGPDEVKYFVNHADVRFIFAHDQEQIDKVLEVKDEMPQLEKAVYWDPKGLWNYDDPLITSIEDALSIGRQYGTDHPGLFEELVAQGHADDIAVIIFTSGTTGLPKAAMISQGGLISSAQAFMELDKYGTSDNYLSFVPVAWITEQLIGVAGSIVSGFVVNFPESAETVTENIRELGARILFFSPRQWESINRLVQSKILDTSWLKRTTYNLCLPVAYWMADLQLAEKSPGPLLRLLHYVAQWLVFRNLRDNLGLSHLRVGYTAGSAVSPEILRYFQAIGVNIKQIYGSSEMGLVTAHRDGNIRPETSGQPLPGAEVVLSEEGEILVKNVGMFVSYYKNSDAYAAKFADGWYQSGDYGHIDEAGHLIVIDRMEDLRSLKGGKKFSPQYPEVRLRFSPYIKEVLVVGGEDRDAACCLVNIDLDNVGRWAEANRIAYTTFADLSQKDEVIELIRAEVDRVNHNLPEEARLKKFLNMAKEFDADEAELTRTRKLRRTFLEERYKDLIDALYSGVDSVQVESTIEYRDGRKGTMKRSIKICHL
jgi:long-chain acyl-CoA synthetase